MFCCISRNNPLIVMIKKEEFVMPAAGGIVFTIATAALSYLLIAAPVMTHMAHIVSFSLISTLGATGLACFVLGMILYNRRQKQELEVVLEEVKNDKMVDAVEVELKETPVSSLDYIDQIRTDLPPLFNSIEEVLKAFVTGYHKMQNSALDAQHLQTIHQEIKQISGQVDAFLKNPKEILRVAIGIVAFTLIDEREMGRLLEKPNCQFRAGLCNTIRKDLDSQNKEFAAEKPLIKLILQTIIKQTGISDEGLWERIDLLRKSFKEMRNATTQEKKDETAGAYSADLVGLIDYLYTKAKIPEEKIKTWTAHLIPPFLEQWRGSLFDRIKGGITQIHLAYGKGGVFSNNMWYTKLKIGKTWPERFIYPRMKGIIDATPLIPERKVAIQKAAETLFPVLIDPFWNATFNKSHNFRAKVERILNTANFNQLLIKGNQWKDYIDSYATFFIDLANKLKA